MKSSDSSKGSQGEKKTSRTNKRLSEPQHGQQPESKKNNKLTLFDHVKHIRGVQTPDYYQNLSEENRKSFNHFMILRALAMDSSIVQEMAFLYRYFDKIPSPQFYRLLTALVPKKNAWVPWIKTKVVKHGDDLLTLVGDHFKVSKRQANEYVNILIKTEEGLKKLVDICQYEGLSEDEINKLFEKK